MGTKEEEGIRQEAMRRYEQGEKPVAIYESLGRSKRWFFKWRKRYQSGNALWYEEESRAPDRVWRRVSAERESAIVEIRERLTERKYSQIGGNAINWELEKQGKIRVPLSTLNRVLKRRGLTRKAEQVPTRRISYIDWLSFDWAGVNNIHQADLVGPRL